MAALPHTLRPTRMVSPTIFPCLLRMQLMRCKVLSTPARLSPPNCPASCTASSRSALETSSSPRGTSPTEGKRASGTLPRSITTSTRSLMESTFSRASRTRGGSSCRSLCSSSARLSSSRASSSAVGIGTWAISPPLSLRWARFSTGPPSSADDDATTSPLWRSPGWSWSGATARRAAGPRARAARAGLLGVIWAGRAAVRAWRIAPWATCLPCRAPGAGRRGQEPAGSRAECIWRCGHEERGE
mmetsp:Transcript_13736/g.43441  ORF Transcript_13736/g.43441 Transcript_13736/m.43441 type:complete len:244 (-) Transcript_13736:14-745(-)